MTIKNTLKKHGLLTELAMHYEEWPLNFSETFEFIRSPFPDSEDKYLVTKLDLYGEAISSIKISLEDWKQEKERLVNKPSWDNAPEWANYMAQNHYGEWHWYQDMPFHIIHDSPILADSIGNKKELASIGKIPKGVNYRENHESRARYEEIELKKGKLNRRNQVAEQQSEAVSKYIEEYLNT